MHQDNDSKDAYQKDSDNADVLSFENAWVLVVLVLENWLQLEYTKFCRCFYFRAH